ncbi:hypothetical protein D7D25_15470 [Proteiniphilum sp. X52]|nr:hypothetical protein D7D25_15470 [Proteiniphilum sp. X52]
MNVFVKLNDQNQTCFQVQLNLDMATIGNRGAKATQNGQYYRRLKSICNLPDNDKTCFMGYNQSVYSVKLWMSISYGIVS